MEWHGLFPFLIPLNSNSGPISKVQKIDFISLFYFKASSIAKNRGESWQVDLKKAKQLFFSIFKNNLQSMNQLIL